MRDFTNEILELIRRTSSSLPKDVEERLRASIEKEEPGSAARGALETIIKNIGNSLGGDEFPSIHFEEVDADQPLVIELMLKGGGCENVGAQYSLPDNKLGAGRDLAGVRKVVVDAVQKAQGKGCAPGILGVSIGGDRSSSYVKSKEVLFSEMGTRNEDPKIAELEERLTKEANEMGIGPMGFGGQTTVLDTKITGMHRLPASYFVSVSYMCWAYRRRKMTVQGDE